VVFDMSRNCTIRTCVFQVVLGRQFSAPSCTSRHCALTFSRMSSRYFLRTRRARANAVPECTLRAAPADSCSDDDFAPSESSNASESESEVGDAAARTTSSGRRSMQAKLLNSADIGDLREPLFHVPGEDAPSSFEVSSLRRIRSALLDWYVENYREFPWRQPPRYRPQGKPCAPRMESTVQSSPGAPYGVWVSEVMSQQTRISVVCEYWTRWMVEFPTVEALASASLERVNEMWSGLGYYRRAKYLHDAAIQLVKQYGGKLPGEAAELKKIKGIGSYTAGAIASIAFDEPVPAVDGNVERVLSRLLPGIAPNREPSRSQAFKSHAYEKLASDLVMDIECAGDFNQAIMELGATVCTPKRPKCGSCPLRKECGTHAEAIVSEMKPPEFAERYPVRDATRKVKVRDETVFVSIVSRFSSCGDLEYLMTQRPKTGLLAGLWECPNVVLTSRDALKHESEAGRRTLFDNVLRNALSLVQGTTSLSERHEVGSTVHVFSHIRQSLHAEFVLVKFSDEGPGCSRAGVDCRWLSGDAILDSAVATQMRKVLNLATAMGVTVLSTRQRYSVPDLEAEDETTTSNPALKRPRRK
jgi:A/G-specific adenine glycosylase